MSNNESLKEYLKKSKKISGDCAEYNSFDEETNSDIWTIVGISCCINIYNLDENGQVTSYEQFSALPIGTNFSVQRGSQSWGYCE